jgi:hypothetical protein
MASVYRLPRNAICAPCHEGAKAIIGFLNKADEQQQEEGGHGSVLKSRGSVKTNSPTKVQIPHSMICSLLFLIEHIFPCYLYNLIDFSYCYNYTSEFSEPRLFFFLVWNIRWCASSFTFGLLSLVWFLVIWMSQSQDDVCCMHASIERFCKKWSRMLTGLYKAISFRPFSNRLLCLCRVIRTYGSELPKVFLCSKNLRNAVQSVFSLILAHPQYVQFWCLFSRE